MADICDPSEWFFVAVGLGLGAAVAVIIDRLIMFLHDRKQHFETRNALKERFEANIKLGNALWSYFDSGGKPNFLFDTGGILVWLTQAQKSLTKEEVTDINACRYQLEHLNAKLTALYSVAAYGIKSRAGQCGIIEHQALSDERFEYLKSTITAHLQTEMERMRNIVEWLSIEKIR